MSNDRDPALQKLFDVARQELSHEAFTSQVMAQIDRQRRMTLIGWTAIGTVLAMCGWMLATPILELFMLTSQVLPQSLIEFEDQLLTDLLTPVNSISGAIAIGFLGLRMFYRKIFS